MAALKSLLNLAQIEANRQNAARSTGPRTEAGKARSRRNAVRHGLTGEGIALPSEDEAAVADRFAALEDQFRPATPLGVHTVRRLALAMIRTERAASHEAASLAIRVRHAAEEFDRSRSLAAREALVCLREGDGQARSELLRSPEGIARLIEELRGLRLCLAYEKPVWSRSHGARLDACFGTVPDDLLVSRVAALTELALGSGVFLTARDRAAIAESALTPVNWALRQLAALIDHEVAALRADDAALDRDLIEADRAGAADRALFDPSPAAQLARRYEATAVREIDRALRLLHAVEVGPGQAATGDDHPDEPRPSEAGADDSGAAPDEPLSPSEPIESSGGVAVKLMPENSLSVAVASFGESCPSSASLDPSSPASGTVEPALSATSPTAVVSEEGATLRRIVGPGEKPEFPEKPPGSGREGGSQEVNWTGPVVATESTGEAPWSNLIGSDAHPAGASGASLHRPCLL